MKGMLTVFLLLVGFVSYSAAQTIQKTLIGCFNRQPNGVLQFGAVPSGELFALSGETDLAEAHVNQLVRVSGEVQQTFSNSNSPATLTIASLEPLAGSCTADAPATSADGVPGKVGDGSVAVPFTDTFTEGETTPGSQVEITNGQPAASRPSSRPAAEAPTAPVHPEQFGQSQAAADTNATSVESTEITPHHTLGVIGDSLSEPATAPK